MRKIPTLFERDGDGDRRYVLPKVAPGCEWVAAGDGVPTRKFDGTCFMLDGNGDWWARREVKEGKPAPSGFVTLEHDPETGKTVGWEPADQSSFAKLHAEALGCELSDAQGANGAPASLAGKRVELTFTRSGDKTMIGSRNPQT